MVFQLFPWQITNLYAHLMRMRSWRGSSLIKTDIKAVIKAETTRKEERGRVTGLFSKISAAYVKSVYYLTVEEVRL